MWILCFLAYALNTFCILVVLLTLKRVSTMPQLFMTVKMMGPHPPLPSSMVMLLLSLSVAAAPASETADDRSL